MSNVIHIGICNGCTKNARIDEDGLCNACIKHPLRGKKWIKIVAAVKSNPIIANQVYNSISSERGKQAFLEEFGSEVLDMKKILKEV